MSTVQAGTRTRGAVELPSVRQQDRVREQAVRAALQGTNHAVLSSVTCQVDRGLLVLRGRVASDNLRQVVYAAVSKVEGIVLIDDQMEAEWLEDTSRPISRHAGVQSAD